MSYPILYSSTETDFSHNGFGILGDCESCDVVEEANGIFELVMTYPMDGLHYENISERAIIKVKPNQVSDPQLFRIYAISRPMSGIVSVFAEHISYDLSGIPVNPFSSETAVGALNGLTNNAVVNCPFEFWTDIGDVAKFNVPVPSSIRSCLGGGVGSILDVYGGEYEFDNFTVKLHSERGQNRGVSIRYGKNLTDIKQEQNCSSVATGVYPYWVSTEGTDLVELPEKIVNAPGTYNFVKIRTLDLSFEFETQPTVEELRAKTESYIRANNIGVPEVSLTVSFAQIEQSEEYKNIALLERVSLFDTVSVEFPALGVSASAKVVKIVYDAVANRVKSATLGSVRANIADTIANQQQEIKKAPTKSELRKAQEAATAWLTNGKGYAYFRKDDAGNIIDILFMDTQDVNTAVNVMRVGQSGIGFSHSGVNGLYESAWTIDGKFIADFITTGQIVSQNGAVVYDLNTGTMTINGAKDGKKTKFVMSADGVNAYSENSDGKIEHTLEFNFGANGNPSGLWNPSYQENTGFSIGSASGELDIGTTEATTTIYGSTIELHSAFNRTVVEVGLDYLSIMGKTVSWRDNGDGTAILIGQ